MADQNKQKKQEATKKEQKEVAKKDGTYSFSNFAGDVSSLSKWIGVVGTGVTETTNLINQLDSALSELANLKLDGNCKGKPPALPDTGGGDIAEIQADCNPFKNLPGFGENPSGEEIAATVLGIVTQLLGPSRFPDCVADQYRRFLSIVPTEYYLLYALRAAALKVQDPVQQLETIGPCKNIDGLGQQLENLDDEIPGNFIRSLPRLPYIPIPDLYQLIINLILETICFTLCSILTPIIEKLGEISLYDFEQDEDKAALGVQQNQPLQKIPIEQFLTDTVLTEIKRFVDKNVSNPEAVTKEVIKDYIVSVQSNESIVQEDFVFLLFGKLNCGVYETLLNIPETVDVFELTTESKVLTFFSFVGSVINLFGFVDNSKAKVCEPDPCDVKTQELVVEGIANLCDLLNPEIPLNIPTSAILEQGGAFDFIASSLKQSYDSIAALNETYNPLFQYGNDDTKKSSYIEKYSGFLLNFNEALMAVYSQKNELTGQDRIEIRKVVVELRDFYYSNVFPFADIIAAEQTQKEGYDLIASSDDFQKDGVTLEGVASQSLFKFDIYNRFSKSDIKNRIKAITAENPSNADEVEEDMNEFNKLKEKYFPKQDETVEEEV